MSILAETAPLLAWFAERELLEKVNGQGDEETVFARLTDAVDGRLSVGDVR